MQSQTPTYNQGLKLGIMQPYFMPYIGYWQLMKAADKYVVYDDVNYIKGGWVARNNILMNGAKKMFILRLNGASPNKHFNEITVADDLSQLLKTLQHTYRRAPYFEQTMELLTRIASYPDKTLSAFIANSFREVLQYLNIDTKIILSSTIEKNNDLRGKEKVLEICRILGATTYYNAIGGQELYDKGDFREHGVDLRFVETPIVEYPQLGKEFVPYLSIIDVLMNNSPEEVNVLLDNYKLK